MKNISRPIRVWQWTPDGAPQRAEPEEAAKQKVRFATASDGVQIAWASIGSGVPVLKAPNWLNHVEYEWQNPCWRPFLLECSRRFELIRFDQRGNGLSDRDVEEISEDAMQRDISAVVEAAGLERFALMGISQGAAFSVRYAAENPDRVRCLIILGGYLRGRLLRDDTEQHELHRVQADLIRQGWGSPNPVFRHFFTSTFMPDAPPETASSFDELQRVSTHMNEALQIREMNARTDVRALAAKIRVPTLVLHAKGDRVCPIEEGRLVARTVPGASFVELPGNNHALTEGTPALAMFLEEVQDFLARHAG
ncbi:MAG: alpha/beta hydrolase [Pseudomonadota bacterium]